MDEIFTTRDGRKVFCAAGLDSKLDNDLASITRGLERARDRGEVIELYAHIPGVTLSWEKLEAVLAKVAELELTWVTYPELGASLPRGGVAISFDDAAIEAWTEARPLFQRHGARVTFFVTRYDLWSSEQRALLHQLADDGHAIEAHARRHQNGPAYVTEYGLAAYVNEEVVPSLEVLRADGFQPTTFAYPFGARTGEMDRAVLEHFDRVRSISYSSTGLISDPCPE